ncbi:MAG: alkaline phosphatase family protein [Acidobacteriota bacterium]|nr:alkaline phosphatase family protein [Acidobacteriota bacterium]
MSRRCLSNSLPSSNPAFRQFRERRGGTIVLLSAVLLLYLPALGFSQTKRVVTVQLDGLPFDVVDRFVHERDPRTGKSQLPWIDHIFYQRGTRLANFYVRGMSLSAPSWSLIDTGQHLQIKGNVEFDRYTLQTYDYLNFIPFYVNATAGKRIDMQGVEVLDSIGIPLLADAYPHNEVHAPFSLFQRSPRYVTFQMALRNKFKKDPRDLLDEWTMGFELMNSVPDQLVREVVEGINDQRLRYLELVLTTFDHMAHHNNDRESHLFALQELDAILGEIWTAIQKSPLASETTLIVVSDHGINSDERVYSQGYNLVKLLGSPAGGGHHVVTKRRVLIDYAIKGINPFVQVITTTTRDSYYLKGQSVDYPTAMLDFDGNERASVHFRDSTLNLLQIILQQLQRTDLSAPLRNALTNEFFKALDGRRTEWRGNLDQLNEELGALRRGIERQRELCAAQPKKFTREEAAAGLDDQAKRVCVWLDIWMGQESSYSEYARTLTNLLALRKENFNAFRLRIDDVIHKRAMGERNNIHQLQHYVVGIGPGGLVLNPDGSLDMDKSFVHLDYFSLLRKVTVNNNVQAGVANQPVDLIAVRLPSDSVAPLVNETGIEDDMVWVYAGPDKQALILSREDEHGQLSFRYVPIKNLTQDEDGRLHFDFAPWSSGLPLQMLEDQQLRVPEKGRETWLSEWHTDLEWLRALHKTRYSNGLIGLPEELARHLIGRLSLDEAGISSDERLRRRMLRRQRVNIEADMLIVGSDHWNFDVRGFNPGGNHGSFFRISTHSTFMLAGGDRTGIPRAAVVEEPYDSLSFVPTVLALTGNLRDHNNPSPVLWDKGFRRFPGRPVKEVLAKTENQKIAATGATASP